MKTIFRQFALVTSAFAALCAADAEVTMPSLSWTPSNNKVSVSGNIATIALPGTTKQSGWLTTSFDMSSFVGKAFDITINAKVEGVGGLTYAWEGLKFQFSFQDDLRGVSNHIDGTIPQKEGTTQGWEQLRIHFDPSKYRATSATVALGIQSAYGTARFDLSTFAIRETPAICEATNQNLIVSYPPRMRDMAQLKGVMSPTGDMNEGDFRTLGDWGATIIRFEMANCPSSAFTNITAYLEWVRGRLDHLENVILPNADKYGLLVVVDLHNTLGGRIDGYYDFAIMDDDVFYEAWIDLWREIATRFKGDKRIYGYDLCNEPRQNNPRKRSYWQIQQSAAEAIREIDPEVTIVMEADAMDAPDAFFYLSPLSLDNVVYQVHMYEPGSYTHQGLESNPYGATYPGTNPNGTTFNKAWLREQLAPVRAFQQKHHCRILVGEFSAICWAPGAETYLKDLTDIFNEYGWDWCYMAFRAWGGWSVEHQEREIGTRWDFEASPSNPRKSAILAAIAAEPAVADFAETWRRIEVTNLSGSSATLSFGKTDGKAYTLAVGWGDADGGADTNAWANFAFLDAIGASETTRTVALPQGWGGAGATRLRYFLLGAEQSPATRLQYVDSDGSQWIDTMVRGASGIVAEADVACLSAANATLLGSRSSGDASRFFPLRWTATGKWSYGYGSARTLSAAAVGTDVRHQVRATLRAGEQSVVVDDASAGTIGTDATERDTELPMFLFAANYDGEVAEGASARLWGARIEAYGKTARDFVPCRDLNGVVCLYDRVSGEYFRPQGGALAAGPAAARDFVVRATGPLVKASGDGDLVVEHGDPITLSGSARYNHVYLHDALTLTDGTLSAGTIEVLPPAGGVIVANGGVPSSSSRISLSADAASATGVADVLRLESGRTTIQCATNYNADVDARIVFAGGSMGVSSWSGTPLCTTGGSRWVLEGENGHSIHIGELGQQRFHWHTGDGRIVTRGNCNVVISDTQASSAYRGVVWFDDARTVWDHTGNFVISNGVLAVCGADDCLPHGNDTGGIRMTWVNRGLPAPMLDLNGHSIAVNELNAGGGGIVTNSAATRATLRFGENDLGGLLTLGYSQNCDNIDILKTGVGQNGLDVGSSSFGALSVKEGRFLVRGKETNTVSLAALSVAADAKFIVTSTTVRVSSYSPAGTVQLQGTGRLLYDTLVIEEGSPFTLDATEDCSHVLLRDALTLPSGGTLASPFVEVDGLGGGLVMDGGTFPSSSRLRLVDGLAAPEGEAAGEPVATVMTLCDGETTLQCATNANPDVAARILFDGGILRCTSFSGKPLCSENGGKWILEGSATAPIRFGNLGLQRMDWLTGEGSVETRGDCDVVFDDDNYNAANNWRGTIYLNTSNTVWNHTGDLVLSNAIDVICHADDCLPYGPQTGIVRMKWVNRAGPPPPRLDLNGHSVAVNGINTIAGGIVTNSAARIATLRIGEGDTSGAVALPSLAGGNIGLVKRGAETNTVALGSSDLADLRVEEGTLVVTGASSDTLRAASISVAQGATLVVDGVTISATTLDDSGAIVRIGGGDIEVVGVRMPWFSASASTDTATGGNWQSKPALLAGAYVLRNDSAAVFAAHEKRCDLPRIEATVLQDDAWPTNALGAMLADAVERGAHARILAVIEDDGETLSWRGLVADGGTAAWTALYGVPVVTGAICRIAAEFDFSGETPLVSYLAAAGGGASSPSEPLIRLHNATNATWFPAPGSDAVLAGRVEVSGCGDLFALVGTAASDADFPTPAPSPATVLIIQ